MGMATRLTEGELGSIECYLPLMLPCFTRSWALRTRRRTRGKRRGHRQEGFEVGPWEAMGQILGAIRKKKKKKKKKVTLSWGRIQTQRGPRTGTTMARIAMATTRATTMAEMKMDMKMKMKKEPMVLGHYLTSRLTLSLGGSMRGR